MATLFGREWTRRELEAYTALDQVAGVTRSRLQEGYEQDVEMLELRTGSGLRVGICPARALDPIWADYKGQNLTWRGGNGAVHPAYYQEYNKGWLRGFPGGLNTTCGLSSFGPPCEFEGEYYGLHDRISYTPAREVTAHTRWPNDTTCEISVEGTVRHTRTFGPNLRLDRSYTAALGSNTLRLKDTITNDGFTPEPAVILYHCNFGFPLVEAGARVYLNASETRPRNENAQVGADRWMHMDAPRAGIPEQVYFHDAIADSEGMVQAGIWNPRLSLGVSLRYAQAQLPYFTQWKMLGAGTYVCGLEPSNAPLTSRSEIPEGQLPVLQPGESRTIEIEWTVHETLWCPEA